MELIYKTPNDGEVKNPSINTIVDSIQRLNDWGIGELICNHKGEFYSQLILIFESEHGIILRYCPKNSENEYLYFDENIRNNDTSIVSTFDGGDEWEVPNYYFQAITTTKSIVEHFLIGGERMPSDNWKIIGEDAAQL